MAWANKDPDSKLDYVINWLPWLTMTDPITGLEVIDTIETDGSEWINVDDTDLVSEFEDHTDSTTTIWLSGGTDGTTYYLTNRITTDAGRIQDQTVKLKCKAR